METVVQQPVQIEGIKKKYRTPRLICYGDVASLTRGTGIHGNDGAGTQSKNPCWIAEVLYGVDAPRTHLVRAWLSECYERRELWSLLIVPLYCCFGKRVSLFLRRYPVFQGGFRPLFDVGVERALRDRAATVLLVARRKAEGVQA